MTGKRSSTKKEKVYSAKQKQKLADKIGRLKNREDLIRIGNIICEENPSVTENSNGIFMYFHKFSNQTYHKIEELLVDLRGTEIMSTESDSCSTPKKEYKPYSKDDFPSQDGISPKLKFSNKEKNLIKRQRYDSSLSVENKTNSDVIYQDFDISNYSDSVSETMDKKPVASTRRRNRRKDKQDIKN